MDIEIKELKVAIAILFFLLISVMILIQEYISEDISETKTIVEKNLKRIENNIEEYSKTSYIEKLRKELQEIENKIQELKKQKEKE